ncbi:hypothetical protein FoTM2_004354 [Fusarium oxysporum f. sp. vasinfectum]|nr:hypothetical protein FoTM2_004354 [Fusarium oxysporum f. sp. vasinfectum]
MEREYSTVPWSDLDFIRELRPAIKVPYKPKQCKKFLAELSIASVDGIDAKGGSKSDNKSENKFDTTGFLHDTSLSSYDEQPGVLVFKPLFKQPSFGRWVQMEVKVTESETGVNGDSEDTKYYPVGEVWIGHEKEKPKNPYRLSKHSSSPPTSESTPSYNSSTSITGLNPNSRQTIKPCLTNTKPLKRVRSEFDSASAPTLPHPKNRHNSSTSMTSLNPNSRLTINTNSGETKPYFTITEPLGVTIEFDIASAPALPPPKDWQDLKPYSVVFNTVFEELERQGVVLRAACHPVPIGACHLQQEYQWIRPNNVLWCIPVAKDDIELATGCTLAYAGKFRSLQYRLFMNQSPTRCTNEAMCVTSMMKINGNMGTPEILGYNNKMDYDTWTNFNSIDYNVNANLGGFPTKRIDQDGRITTIITPTAL